MRQTTCFATMLLDHSFGEDETSTATMMGMEDLLWLLLAATVPILLPSNRNHSGWEAWMILGAFLGSFLLDPSNGFSIAIPMPTRQRPLVMGVPMSIVMVPTLFLVLAHTLSTASSDTVGAQWNCYAKIALFSGIPNKTISACLYGIAVFLDPEIDATTAAFSGVVSFHILPTILTKDFAKSFTFGEWKVVSLLLTVAADQYARMVGWLPTKNNESFSSSYPLVALSGSLSCIAFASLGAKLQQRLSWWVRLGLNVLGPLFFVDLSLYMTENSFDYEPLPILLSIQWLVGFLLEKENGYERFWGLLYWVGILAIGSYPTYRLLSLPPKYKPSVVVTRKWFHLIAVLLFGPVTWQFPQLMSLSYAIASCVLIVLETLRADSPMLQGFYFAFLDNRKDDGGQIIVSHIFLIVGCGLPLWISQLISNERSELPPLLLLAEFGVLCIGIGDAMGAVVGKSMGKHKWGRNQRTVEGSLAMWFSMTIIGMFACTSVQHCVALVVATTFTTVLEAFTEQLDNLALPISGSCVVLLVAASMS